METDQMNQVNSNWKLSAPLFPFRTSTPVNSHRVEN